MIQQKEKAILLDGYFFQQKKTQTIYLRISLFKKKYKTMKKYTEENLQHDCFLHVTNNYGLKHHNPRLFMFSVPNELAMTIRGALLQTKLPKSKVDQIISILTQKFKNTGLRSGVSDTVVIFPGKTAYIEFKTPTGVQSDKQKEFEQVVKGNGQSYYVCRSLEQFKEIIQTELQND